MAKTVVALYDNFEDAQNVVQDLLNRGFRRDDISLVANDEQGRFASGTGGESPKAAGEGAGLGAVLGGLAGLLIGLGALAIPGIGPVLAAGPLAATLAGAGIGAVTGGLIGALVDAGIPEEEARYYAEGVRRGGTLVTVRSEDGMMEQTKDVLNSYHPVDLHERAGQWQEMGWTGFDHAANPAAEAGVTEAPYSSAMTQPRRDYTAYENDFRQDYERAYARAGYSFDQYQPAYRYGYDLGENPTYRGRDWQEIEPQARRDWEMSHPNASWHLFQEAVRYGWERRAGASGAEGAGFGRTGETQYGVSNDPAAGHPATSGTQRFAAADQSWADEGNRSGSDLTWDPDQYGTSADVERTSDRDVEPDFDRNRGFDQDLESARTGQHVDPGMTGTAGGVFEQEPASDADRYSATGNAFDYDTDYRQHYATFYAARGGTYDRYRPAYDFGRNLAGDQRYQGRQWQDVEQYARRDWEQHHPNSAWDDVKDAIRHAWDSVTGHNR